MKIGKEIIVIFLFLHFLFILYCNIFALSNFDEYKNNLPKRAKIIINNSKIIVRQVPDLYKRIFDYYRNYSGITGYVFFSPDPPDSYRLFFIYKLGTIKYIEEMPMETFEGDLRKLCGYDYLKDIPKKQYQDLVARSIAARFHEKRPNIREFTMTTAFYILPNSNEFSKGIKPKFLKHISYDFQIDK